MIGIPDSDPLAQSCSDDLEAVADRYLDEGLDPACVLAVLAAIAVKTAQRDPEYKERYLNYLADLLSNAADITIVDK